MRRRWLLSLSWFLMAAASGGVHADGETGKPQPTPGQQSSGPCSAPEFRQLDFWVGDWQVRNHEGKHVGESRIEHILNSCVIQENWQGANGWLGKSFNAFNRAKGKWQQFWVSSWGTVTEFSGEASNGRIVYLADTVDREGKPVLRRLTLTRLGPDKVRQFAEISYDGGASWKPEYDFTYTRQPAS